MVVNEKININLLNPISIINSFKNKLKIIRRHKYLEITKFSRNFLRSLNDAVYNWMIYSKPFLCNSSSNRNYISLFPLFWSYGLFLKEFIESCICNIFISIFLQKFHYIVLGSIKYFSGVSSFDSKQIYVSSTKRKGF